MTPLHCLPPLTGLRGDLGRRSHAGSVPPTAGLHPWLFSAAPDGAGGQRPTAMGRLKRGPSKPQRHNLPHPYPSPSERLGRGATTTSPLPLSLRTARERGNDCLTPTPLPACPERSRRVGEGTGVRVPAPTYSCNDHKPAATAKGAQADGHYRNKSPFGDKTWFRGFLFRGQQESVGQTVNFNSR
jgi:hypothetical protein